MIKYILALLLLLWSTNVCAQCGVERADVKQLLDNPTLVAPEVSTIGEIAKLDLVKVGNSTPRSEFERRVLTVRATLIGYKLESDRDIHMVIKDSGKTMIVESVDPACPDLNGSPHLSEFKAVREWIAKNLKKPTLKFRKVNIAITARGVLFMDRLHKQTGVAKNGIELHPLFAIEKQ